MKRYKILTAAVAAAGLSGASAMAQFSYQNGDLLAAFGNGGGTDVIVNLGSISSFQQGVGNTWDLSSVLTSVFGSVNSGLYWSVFGVNDQSIGYDHTITQGDPNTLWATIGRSNPANQTHAPLIQGNSSSFQLPVGDIESIGNITSPGQAAPGLIVDFSPGIEEVSSSVGNYSTDMSSPYSGNFAGDWYYNVLNHGVGVSDLYQNDPSTPRASYLGNFGLDSGGVLTFSPTPEPSTWAMIGSGLLVLFALRRRNQFNR
jgi:hypothetical protein